MDPIICCCLSSRINSLYVQDNMNIIKYKIKINTVLHLNKMKVTEW